MVRPGEAVSVRLGLARSGSAGNGRADGIRRGGARSGTAWRGQPRRGETWQSWLVRARRGEARFGMERQIGLGPAWSG